MLKNLYKEIRWFLKTAYWDFEDWYQRVFKQKKYNCDTEQFEDFDFGAAESDARKIWAGKVWLQYRNKRNAFDD